MAEHDPEVDLKADLETPAYQPRALEVCNCCGISLNLMLTEPRMKRSLRNSLELQQEQHSVCT